ncbi:MAG: hypothetical protein HZC10_09960 [Nitrospirae bacterium]|nr:hypothetical protein [Nitrospirota bacterium]
MKGLITKKEAREFKRRWKAVNEAEKMELRHTSPAQKFKQLLVLMQWVKDFGWDEALKEGEAEVRERWLKLKKLYKV